MVLIEAAIREVPAGERFGALAQRAGLLHRAGRVHDALDAFTAALAERPDPPTLDVGELLNNFGILLGFLDRNAEATAAISEAQRVFASLGIERRVVDMTHNLGWLAGRRGDIVGALRLLDEAEAEHLRLGLPIDALMPDRCEVLLAAGLLSDAREVAERAATSLGTLGDAADRAEALLLCAQIQLRQSDWTSAASTALRAATEFHTCGRVPWAAHARVLAIEALHATGGAPSDAIEQLVALRSELEQGDLTMALHELDVLHARLLVAAGHTEDARSVLDRTPIGRLPTATRPGARAVLARIAIDDGDRARARTQLRRALSELHTARSTLGSLEMRAAIGVHAEEVMRLGVSLAAQTRQPWSVLAWSEQGRARALDPAPVTAIDAETLARASQRVRDIAHSLAHTNGDGQLALRSELATATERLTRVARRRERGPGSDRRFDRGRVRSALGSRTLVQLVVDGDTMLAVTVERGRAQLVEAGRVDAWYAAGDAVRRCMTRVIDGRGDERVRAAAEPMLERAASDLDLLLSPLLGRAGVDPGHELVLVVTPRMHAIPWATLPSLRERAFVLAPSVMLWVDAMQRASSSLGGFAALAGPGLDLAAAEVARLRTSVGGRQHSDEIASCSDVLDAIRRHGTVHLACHGRFVADNPLMSSLLFADGPLYVHDLEQLDELPARIVLSACSTAMSVSTAGDELLGIVAALLGLGVGGVVASPVRVPDEPRTADVMVAVHAALADGDSLPHALRHARRDGGRVAELFCCYGAG